MKPNPTWHANHVL